MVKTVSVQATLGLGGGRSACSRSTMKPLLVLLLGSEPPHIPVRTPEGDCKFWLEPSFLLASNRGVRSHDLRQIERLVFEYQQELKKAYYERHPR